MGLIYGNTFLKESVVQKPIIDELKFVVFEEYCNYNQLLEACTDESERAILEAKCEVLYEVSLKDIGNKIMDFLKKIKEVIKKCITKIKEFFTKQKEKDLEKRIRELEETLKDKDIDIETIKAERDRYKDLSKKNYEAQKDAMKFAKDQMLEKELKERELEANKAASKDILDQNIKLKDKEINLIDKERQKIATRLAKIVDQVVDNDLLYFDAYDFLVKDFDPSRVYSSNEFSQVTNDENYYREENDDDRIYERKTSRLEGAFEGLMKKANIIPEDLAKKYLIREENGNINLKDGGYNHYKVNDMVRSETKAKKEADYTRFCTLDKLLKHCKWLSAGHQVSGLNAAMNAYNTLIGKVENFIIKLGGNSAVNQYESHDKVQPENIKALRTFVKELDNSVRYMAVLVNYAGKASGAASQAIIVLTTAGVVKDTEEY